ncbi:hypothetical protein TrispH2_005214 [Trichoplax sp. H2]|nr:hypothetical protein TrispH2_005214 [Trichoplax sp. H2]|eukprot:RDD42840.1 hypothetical protein TrispH2_005214 [Trichoplax sp. H2]
MAKEQQKPTWTLTKTSLQVMNARCPRTPRSSQQIQRSFRKMKRKLDERKLSKHIRLIDLNVAKAEVLDKWVSPQFDRKAPSKVRNRKKVKFRNCSKFRTNARNRTFRFRNTMTPSRLNFQPTYKQNTDTMLDSNFDPELSSSQSRRINDQDLSPIKSDHDGSNSLQSCSTCTSLMMHNEDEGDNQEDIVLVPATPLSSYKYRWTTRSIFHHN